MNAKLLSGMVALAVMSGVSNAAVFTDKFDDGVLNPIWTAEQSQGTFAEITNVGDGQADFSGVPTEGYAHLQTAPDQFTRVDGIMRTNNFGTGRWGMGTSIYFDANNWVSLKIGTAGGQYGWVREMVVNGVHSTLTGNTVNTDLRYSWLILGVELTATEVRFYGSDITDPEDDHLGQTNIDANVSVIPEFTIVLPATFTGLSRAIIGKGFTRLPDAPNPDFNNVGGDLSSPTDNYIDLVRLTTVPEPAGLGLLAISGVAALPRRRGRQ